MPDETPSNGLGLHIADEIAVMDTPTLRRELARSVTITAETLLYMGRIWAELERRGEDLSGLRSGLAAYLPAIASGRLKAEAVIRYANKAMLLRRLMDLSAHQQEMLLEAGEVEVAEPGEGGGFITRRVPLSDIRSEHLRLVFGPHGLRTVAQQQRYALPFRAAATAKPTKRNVDTTLNFDGHGHLRSGRMAVLARGEKIKADDLVEALEQFYGVEIKAAVLATRPA